VSFADTWRWNGRGGHTWQWSGGHLELIMVDTGGEHEVYIEEGRADTCGVADT
jgi:hypothetical protein